MRVSVHEPMVVIMKVDYAQPNVGELRRYLKYQGWQEQGEGPAGTLWVKGGRRVGVPHSDDNPDLICGAIERIARAQHSTARETADAACRSLYDVACLRTANDHRVIDTIPLKTAERILKSARTMLRATATTAGSEKAQIGSYSHRGDQVVHQALIGHTERGSFVIPVLIPLPEPLPPDPDQSALTLPWVEYHRVAPEPFERRVVRTFAQSMQAVYEMVVEPARDLSTDEVFSLVSQGVSREFCSALHGILSETAVSDFEVSVQWAAAVPAPEALPNRVVIPAGAADLISRVAERLRRQPVDVRQIFSGMIVQLRHAHEDDQFGEIAVSTVRQGRTSEIYVRLPLPDYRRAWQWHDSQRAVLVEGDVKRVPGGHLRVDQPVRCHPVNESVLIAPSLETGSGLDAPP